MSTNEPHQPDAAVIPVSCHLAYEVNASSTQTKKKTKTTKKDTKVKQFTHSFSPMTTHYVDLLNVMVVKHTTLKVKNKATEERMYSCKIHVPPAKYIFKFTYMRY
jgi:hypothetical protein